jgi:hypothetical protein
VLGSRMKAADRRTQRSATRISVPLAARLMAVRFLPRRRHATLVSAAVGAHGAAAPRSARARRDAAQRLQPPSGSCRLFASASTISSACGGPLCGTLRQWELGPQWVPRSAWNWPLLPARLGSPWKLDECKSKRGWKSKRERESGADWIVLRFQGYRIFARPHVITLITFEIDIRIDMM